MLANQERDDVPRAAFLRAQSVRTPSEIFEDAIKERFETEIADDLIARFGNGITPAPELLPLVALFCGFAATRLIRSSTDQSGQVAILTSPAALPEWRIPTALDDSSLDAALLLLSRSFVHGRYEGNEWSVRRDLERQQHYASHVLAMQVSRLAAQATEAVLAWIDPILAEVLDGSHARRLRARNVVEMAHEVSWGAIRRVTQGYTLTRSVDQMMVAARKARQQLLSRNPDDEQCLDWESELASSYHTWLSRETPPLGVVLLVTARALLVSAELRGLPIQVCLFNSAIFPPFREYVDQRLPDTEWYAAGQTGIEAWSLECSRYWSEGLASLVPRLRATVLDLRGDGRVAEEAHRVVAADISDVDSARRPGESPNRWQVRLRELVTEARNTKHQCERQHTAIAAALQVEHEQALRRVKMERDQLYQRLLRADQAVASATETILRVEQDAQFAMARVVQLESAIQSRGEDLPMLISFEAVSCVDEDAHRAVDAAETSDAAAPVSCFGGRRLFVFTGQLRQGIHEQIADRFRQLGCDEVQVKLIHRDHGPKAFRPTDCIVIDLTFASHSDTAKVRVKVESAGAWMYQTKRGPSTLATAAAREWLATRS